LKKQKQPGYHPSYIILMHPHHAYDHVLPHAWFPGQGTG
jgi:hypothetical protein